MGTSYRFIADPADGAAVLNWFRALKEPPLEVATALHTVLYFSHLGELHHAADESVDAEKSPIVTVVHPRTAREALWTVGEIHFRTGALRRLYPSLYRVSQALALWLDDYPCIYSVKDRDNEYSYYLEGTVKNETSPIYAFQSGLDALSNERYFVGARDNDAVLDKVCKTLKLRGVDFGRDAQ
ncbi:hypothetical protein L2Y90_33750 (plasmid) [Burkholderia pyrrocinia]|uniref:hypothetical protein n=1 Tax=Burkholderia pyrrocinia TaxID=60550 RepID=UPI00215AF8EA|nr:hypothetical protein [Burkholderia pyrrocinia]UVE70088.1 hypothetical protein L2Y90_33750 [Burkholderia pyrrocinia]